MTALCYIALIGVISGLANFELVSAKVAPGAQLASQLDPSRPPGISGSGASSAPAVSPDGRFVVFVSAAGNLVTNDHNGTLDVFLRDRVLHQTTLLSVNVAGTEHGK